MKTDKIIVWGIGQKASEFVKEFGTERIFCFADNNEKFIGQTFMNKKVMSLDEIQQLPHRYLIVISTEKYEQEIRNQLTACNYTLFKNMQQYKIDMIFGENDQKKQRIILMNTHDNFNVGDHLITLAEMYFFRKYFSEYELIEIPLLLCTKELSYICRYITPNDWLAVTGGGFLGSLWLEGGENNVRAIVQSFPDNRIIILPQTMYFENNTEGQRQKEISANIYNKHKHLTFCFRDKSSYMLGMEILLESIRKLYLPDMAMLLDRSYETYLRSDILLCLRDDKEKIVPDHWGKNITAEFKKRGFRVKKMSMLETKMVSQIDRMDVVNKKLRQIQKSKLVVTDRLHCMVLCAISGTPCVALDNLSGKVKGVYYWIKNNPYIRILDDPEDDIWNIVQNLLALNDMAYNKETVDKEFDNLVNYIKTGA